MTNYNEKTSRDNVSIITETMHIKGDIVSEDLIVLEGKVKGNITSNDNVETSVSSVVEGNIKASSAMVSGEVKGNISCDESVTIDLNTTILGDISAYNIKIAGKVVGNVTARNSVSLKENAVIKGNVTCSLVSIDSGAKIDGNFTMLNAEVPVVEETAGETEEYSEED